MTGDGDEIEQIAEGERAIGRDHHESYWKRTSGRETVQMETKVASHLRLLSER